jgi:hypothetical protein
MPQGPFQINSPGVVAETLDGETTIVDLERGTYFALNKPGSVVWDAVVAGADLNAAAAALGGAYGIADDAARADVERLVGELQEHQLLVGGAQEHAANAAGATVNGANGAGAAEAPPEYVAPELSVYTDMQELLLLDPIHEVDDAGWPSPA